MIRECRECGRPLRSATWTALGIGPVCARKTGVTAPSEVRPLHTRSTPKATSTTSPGQTCIPIQPMLPSTITKEN
ncbi:DUF6011 domain-containing protein [Streptomyces sp. NPDC005918]|uniref:DUF6011 domain-containing protein n=1 Tax=Streptomyces sp. NPDC005918 TaxID=3155454 RepID=UPI0033CC6D22